MDKHFVAMKYILENTKNSDIRNKGLSFFYDSEENRIRLEALNECYCDSSEAIIKIAFNLFNGYTADEFYAIYHLMGVLDSENRKVVLTALNNLYGG